jgi:hypothetical protein
MILGILTKIDTVTEISAYISIVLIILFCLLVWSAYRIKVMLEFYFERDGGKDWESTKKAKKAGLYNDAESEEKKDA